VTDATASASEALDFFNSLADLTDDPAITDSSSQLAREFVAAGGEIDTDPHGFFRVRMPDGRRVAVLVGPSREASTEIVESLPPVDVDPVPHAAVATALRIRSVRRRLLESGAYDYKALAAGREASIEATRQFVSRAQRKYQIFTVEHDGVVLVPAFLLDEVLEPVPRYAEILSPLLAAGSSPWAVWNWMVSPSGWLDGGRPVDLALSHHNLVVQAAIERVHNAA